MPTLTRAELTATLTARQMLLERSALTPAKAIRLLTPMQGQHPTAPFIGLAARVEGFAREDLEDAIRAGDVVKTTLMRTTLHLAARSEYPAYAQLARQARLRTWRRSYPHLDEQAVTAELRAWLRTPRTNAEIRARVESYDIDSTGPSTAVVFARTLLALVQLPPAGFWSDRTRARFVVDPRPLPDPDDAAALVLKRYLTAFGPASRRDIAAWSGLAQRDFAVAFDRIRTTSFRDESGTELLDLPGRPLLPASTRLPVRLLGRWEQTLLAYADRDRIIPPAVQPLNLTLSGDQIVTVDGRVAASWLLERSRDAVQVTITPHVELRRAARSEIRAEAKRTAGFCSPGARRYAIAGV